MSRARHRAKGGKVVAYTAGDSNVMKEAHERKRGGRVHHGEGEEAKHHAGKRARGGKVARRHGGKVEALGHGHHHVGHGHHEYKRARGGAVGSDKRPLSSAATIKFLPEEKGGSKGAGPANERSERGGGD